MRPVGDLEGRRFKGAIDRFQHPIPAQVGSTGEVIRCRYIRPGEVIHDVDYWKKGLRHSVHFTQGIRNAVDSGHTTFLELAPNPVALM